MWDPIAEHIGRSTGQSFSIGQRQSVGGGSINRAFLIADGDRRFFVKTNDPSGLEMFEAEALGLNQIQTTDTLRVPRPICWGVGTSSYLVLEWLALSSAGPWEQMGERLAAMHRMTSDSGFGWYRPNTIGSTPQHNPWTVDWGEFFTQHRLGFQLQLAKGKLNPDACNRLLAVTSRFFADYRPRPALVHGDLWFGNAGFCESSPVIYDPAIYFGDREVDLAMTELFGGFPTAFYHGYQQAYPLEAGYERRKTLYNLYHVLNHLNLFGGAYASQAERMIQQVLKQAQAEC